MTTPAIPDEIRHTILAISIALALAPYIPGRDLGPIKVPKVNAMFRKLLQWGGPLLIIISVLLYLPIIPETEQPSFRFKDAICRPDTLWIVQEGGPRFEPDHLTLELDGIPFHEQVLRGPNSRVDNWYFAMQGRNLPEDLVKDGAHDIRILSRGRDLANHGKVFFSSSPPTVSAHIEKQDMDSYGIFGKAITGTRLTSDTIKVNLLFFHEGAGQKVAVPVIQVVDLESGDAHYEFHYRISNVPNMTSESQAFDSPFFRMEITDQIGNEFHHVQSYAHFVAPGRQSFGTDRTKISVRKVSGEEPGEIRAQIRVSSGRTLGDWKNSDTHPISLLVNGQAGGTRSLSWTDLPDSNNARPSLTVVLRDGRSIGVSFGNQYSDSDRLDSSRVAYRVESRVSDGSVYSSNTEVYSVPLTISDITASPSGLDAFAVTITWKTNLASDSQVEFGETEEYSARSIVDTAQLSEHSITLLEPEVRDDILYHFRVISTSPEVGMVKSGDFSFRFDVPGVGSPSVITGLREIQ